MSQIIKNEQDLPLVAFEKTLLPEEAALIHDYVSNPILDTLSQTFEKILLEEEKT